MLQLYTNFPAIKYKCFSGTAQNISVSALQWILFYNTENFKPRINECKVIGCYGQWQDIVIIILIGQFLGWKVIINI